MRNAPTAIALLLAACTSGSRPPAEIACAPEDEGVITCVDAREVRCEAGGTAHARDCEHVCVEGRGCLRCEPELVACEDERTLAICDAEGTSLEQRACAPNERCVARQCADLCAEAAARHDYAGCEYVAVPIATPQLRAGFSFAVVIANASDHEANVSIEGGALDAAIARVVPARTTETFVLPWIDELSQIEQREQGGRSVIAPRGAYWIRSDVPVLATQWSPLDFRLDNTRCEDGPGCFSFTNDASLLLPLHALGARYHVASYAPLAFEQPAIAGEPYAAVVPGRGLFAIAATEPGETTVTVHASAPLDTPEGGRLEAGTSRAFTLAQGAVLQLVSSSPRDAAECAPQGRRRQCDAPSLDPTGTRIESSAPVAVFSGHGCAHVPFDRPACDHLEEQLLPDVALGARYVLGTIRPLHEQPAPSFARVLSIADANEVRFDPPIRAPITLDAGEHVLVEHDAPLVIDADAPLLVTQLVVGMSFDLEAPGAEGDPAMVLAAPIAQWRREYVFLVPGTYTSAYASVVAPAGTTVWLDGEPLEDTPMRVSDFELHDIALDRAAAVHQLEADHPVALTLHGYAPWTSYAHLGGLTVAPLVE
ncbi:IgGFc-binding protein [Sandaracinus amylolyticus]|nr:IgGFc-binding protein [Sandaracinus amylolyticus]